MKKIALQFEFLIVMDHVEYVCRDFQQLFDKHFIRQILRVFIDGIQHFSIFFKSLLMEFFVSVDLVAFSF